MRVAGKDGALRGRVGGGEFELRHGWLEIC